MTTHVLSYESGDTQSVLWRCGVCRQPIGFARQGFGEPWGSESYYPDDVDTYLGPCPGQYAGPARSIAKDEFLQRFASSELGAFLISEDVRIKGFIQRVMVSSHVDLDDPETLSVLTYAEGASLLQEGRAAVLVQ